MAVTPAAAGAVAGVPAARAGRLPGLVGPPPGPGTCLACGGPTAPTQARCWCCRTVSAALARPAPPLVAVLGYRPGDRAHAALRGYKDAPAERTRHHLTGRVAATLDAFLADHGRCLEVALGPVDGICPVPATSRRGGTDPLEAALDRVAALDRLGRLRLRPGPGPVGHLVASAAAFVVPPGWAGHRVLVVDDTWTTGAHARSAASAVEVAGGTVAGILVVGRSVDPAASPAAGAWWRRAAAAGVRAGTAGGSCDEGGHVAAGGWQGCPVAGAGVPCPAGPPRRRRPGPGEPGPGGTR